MPSMGLRGASGLAEKTYRQRYVWWPVILWAAASVPNAADEIVPAGPSRVKKRQPASCAGSWPPLHAPVRAHQDGGICSNDLGSISIFGWRRMTVRRVGPLLADAQAPPTGRGLPNKAHIASMAPAVKWMPVDAACIHLSSSTMVGQQCRLCKAKLKDDGTRGKACADSAPGEFRQRSKPAETKPRKANCHESSDSSVCCSGDDGRQQPSRQYGDGPRAGPSQAEHPRHHGR